MTEPGTEVWETATESVVFLVRDDVKGGQMQKPVGGKVGAKLTISTTEREYNQQLVADESFDPFTNGLLVPVQVSEDQPELASPNARSRKDLVALFAKAAAAFKREVDKITSETTLRSLRQLADEVDAKQSQIQYLDEKLEAFRPGKQQPSYAEIQGLTPAARPSFGGQT